MEIEATPGDSSEIVAVLGNSSEIEAIPGNSSEIEAASDDRSEIEAPPGDSSEIEAAPADSSEIETASGDSWEIEAAPSDNCEIETLFFLCIFHHLCRSSCRNPSIKSWRKVELLLLSLIAEAQKLLLFSPTQTYQLCPSVQSMQRSIWHQSNTGSI